MKYILYTTYYLAEDSVRNEENNRCLVENINNKLIDKIYLIIQNNDIPEFHNSKLEFVYLGKRPEFSDFFTLIKDSMQFNDKSCRHIIANSDIFFNESLSLLNTINLNRKVVTLTRWDLQVNGDIVFYNKYLSQDVWIFENEIPENIGNYFIGQHGCDNRLLKELNDNNFKIINPSLNVKTIHVHMSNLRPYFNNPNYKYIEGEYLYSFPSGIYKPIKIVWFKFFNRDKFKKYKYSFGDYYYIRFEYYFKSFKNELQKMELNFFQRILSFFPSVYYYLLFKLNQ